MIAQNYLLSQNLSNDYPKLITLKDSTKLVAITPVQMDSIVVKLIRLKDLPKCDSLVSLQKEEINKKDTFIKNQSLFIDFYRQRDSLNRSIKINQENIINSLKTDINKAKRKATTLKIVNFTLYPITIVASVISTYYITNKFK